MIFLIYLLIARIIYNNIILFTEDMNEWCVLWHFCLCFFFSFFQHTTRSSILCFWSFLAMKLSNLVLNVSIKPNFSEAKITWNRQLWLNMQFVHLLWNCNIFGFYLWLYQLFVECKHIFQDNIASFTRMMNQLYLLWFFCCLLLKLAGCSLPSKWPPATIFNANSV